MAPRFRILRYHSRPTLAHLVKAKVSATPAKPAAPKPVQPKRRALCIGINYTGTANELRGCMNDQENLVQKLKSSASFTSSDIVVMNDTCTGTTYPTFSNIWTQLVALRQWVAQWPRTQPLQLVVSYSGHGTSRPGSTDQGETDRSDEAIVPVDFTSRGFITDDTLRQNFIALLPANVTLLLLVDSCNSGTIADLRYSYNLSTQPVQAATNAKYPETACTCVSISACRDNQTAADTWLPDPVTGVYEAQGGLTAAFCTLFQATTPIKQLAVNMKSWVLARNMTQVTQLASSKLLSDTTCVLSA